MPKIHNDIRPYSGMMSFPWLEFAGEFTPEEYYADTHYLSHSMLRNGYDNPEELALQFAGWRNPSSEGEALGMGRRFHLALLQPEVYNETILVVDDDSICAEIGGAKPRATNKYKEWMEQVEKEALRSGQTIIDIAEHQLHQAMVSRVMSVPHIRLLLDDTLREQVVTGIHQGIPTKGLIDCTDGINYVLDVKRVHLKKHLRGYRFEGLQKYIDMMDYDSQLWSYANFIGADSAYILFVPDEYPHTPCLVTLSKDTLHAGKLKYDAMFHEVMSSFNTNTMTLADVPFSVNMTV